MAQQSRRTAALWLLFFLQVVISKCNRVSAPDKSEKKIRSQAPSQTRICFVDSSKNCFIFSIAVLGERTRDKMYQPILGASCFRRLNGTHQTGCSCK